MCTIKGGHIFKTIQQALLQNSSQQLPNEVIRRIKESDTPSSLVKKNEFLKFISPLGVRLSKEMVREAHIGRWKC